MARSLTLAAAALLAAGAAAFPRTCFDIWGTMCLQADIDTTAGTVTFNATCTQATFENPGWCAFGLSLAGSTSMGNAEVFFIAKMANGTVTVEDRFNPHGHSYPECVPAVSQLVTSAALPNGAITATWTRKLAASGQGVAPIAPGQSFRAISAWGQDKNRQSTACSQGWSEHKSTGSATLKF
jgi:hypothetical protein